MREVCFKMQNIHIYPFLKKICAFMSKFGPSDAISRIRGIIPCRKIPLTWTLPVKTIKDLHRGLFKTRLTVRIGPLAVVRSFLRKTLSGGSKGHSHFD